VETSRVLRLGLSPVQLDFSVDLSQGNFAFAIPTGLGANRSESSVFWREGLEKFVDPLRLYFCGRRARSLWRYFPGCQLSPSKR
jgi:hypothetical protein